MKKLIALLLSGCIAVSLGGCGKKKKQKQESAADVSSEAYSEVVRPSGTLPIMTAGTLPDETAASSAATTSAEPNTTSAAPLTTYTTGTESFTETEPLVTEGRLDRNGTYTTKDDVALYLYTYGTLPQNFITKKKAQSLGWSGGSLEPYAPGCCIGGSYFGNYEGALPTAPGREYHECDIDTLGKKSRGAKRIVYSNDGLIYYTEDHYNTFELLYGEE